MSLLTQFYGNGSGGSGGSTIGQPINTGSTWANGLSFSGYSSGYYWLASSAASAYNIVTTDPTNLSATAGQKITNSSAYYYLPGPSGNMRGIGWNVSAPFYVPACQVSGQIGGLVTTVATGTGNNTGRQILGNGVGGFYIQSNDTWNLFWGDTNFPSDGTDYRILRCRPTGLSTNLAPTQGYVATFGTNQLIQGVTGRSGFGKGYIMTTSGFWATPDGVTYTNKNAAPFPVGYSLKHGGGGGIIPGGSADTVILAQVSSSSGTNYLYRSTDDGATWTALGTGNGLPSYASLDSNGSSSFINSICGYNSTSGKFWIWLEGNLSCGLWSSSDLGATWTQTTLNPTIQANMYTGSIPQPSGTSDRIWYSYKVVDTSTSATREVWASISAP